MPLSPRRFTLRHFRAILGMLLTAGAAGLSWLWLVFSHPDILRKFSPIPVDPFIDYCYRTRLATPFLSPDSDGDGVPDWFESVCGTDPTSISAHPEFAAYPVGQTHWIYAGRRTHYRWRLDLLDRYLTRWPPTFRATLTATALVLVPRGSNAAPTAGPLTLAPNADGDLEVDILQTDAPSFISLGLRNANGGNLLQPLFFKTWGGPIMSEDSMVVRAPGWPVSAVYPEVEFREPDVNGEGSLARQTAKRFYLPMDIANRMVGPPAPESPRKLLVWKPVPDAAAFLIEISRADRPTEWFPCEWFRASPDDDNVFFPDDTWFFFPGYDGPLRYRLVSVTKTPPGAPRP